MLIIKTNHTPFLSEIDRLKVLSHLSHVSKKRLFDSVESVFPCACHSKATYLVLWLKVLHYKWKKLCILDLQNAPSEESDQIAKTDLNRFLGAHVLGYVSGSIVSVEQN